MQHQIASFIYVTGAASYKGLPSFQVEVVDTAETMEEVSVLGGSKRVRTLNAEQAEAEGFSLSAILPELNAAAIPSNAALVQENADLLAQQEADKQAIQERDAALAQALAVIQLLQPAANTP